MVSELCVFPSSMAFWFWYTEKITKTFKERKCCYNSCQIEKKMFSSYGFLFLCIVPSGKTHLENSLTIFSSPRSKPKKRWNKTKTKWGQTSLWRSRSCAIRYYISKRNSSGNDAAQNIPIAVTYKRYAIIIFLNYNPAPWMDTKRVKSSASIKIFTMSLLTLFLYLRLLYEISSCPKVKGIKLYESLLLRRKNFKVKARYINCQRTLRFVLPAWKIHEMEYSHHIKIYWPELPPHTHQSSSSTIRFYLFVLSKEEIR